MNKEAILHALKALGALAGAGAASITELQTGFVGTLAQHLPGISSWIPWVGFAGFILHQVATTAQALGKIISPAADSGSGS